MIVLNKLLKADNLHVEWKGGRKSMYSLKGIISAPIVIQANASCDPNNDNRDPTTEQIKSENRPEGQN